MKHFIYVDRLSDDFWWENTPEEIIKKNPRAILSEKKTWSQCDWDMFEYDCNRFWAEEAEFSKKHESDCEIRRIKWKRSQHSTKSSTPASNDPACHKPRLRGRPG